MPQLLRPVVEAIAQGSGLEQPIDAIVRDLGFDTFMYGISASPRPYHESKTFVLRPWRARG